MKIGSLCTGYGGLDMATEAYFDAETVWVSEIDKYASQVIEQRFGVINHGDLKTINWAEVEPIDILTAGYPCQPFSHAGQRKGLQDVRHIWPYIKEAISSLRPRIVVLENVRGHLTLGFDTVLKDLAQIGYDAKWQIVRASDIGAPHQRARLFIIAYPISIGCENQSCCSQSSESIDGVVTNSYSDPCTQPRRTDRELPAAGVGLRTGENQRKIRHKYRSGVEMARQELPPTLDSLERLNPVYVEYMMGLPEGWVTDAGLSRTQQLKMLGNGVVPQQAHYALELLATRP